jgi:hypothetical protein
MITNNDTINQNLLGFERDIDLFNKYQILG